MENRLIGYAIRRTDTGEFYSKQGNWTTDKAHRIVYVTALSPAPSPVTEWLSASKTEWGLEMKLVRVRLKRQTPVTLTVVSLGEKPLKDITFNDLENLEERPSVKKVKEVLSEFGIYSLLYAAGSELNWRSYSGQSDDTEEALRLRTTGEILCTLANQFSNPEEESTI